MTYSLDHTPIVHTHTFIWRQSLYDNLVPLRSNPKMARSLHVILLTPTTAKLKEITPWVHITQLKKVMQPNDENACQTNTYQVSHTGPNWRRMSQLVSQLQLFLEQLLADIWVSSPQGSTFEHVEDYISTLWLQGTFYNFYPFEIQFFSTVICLILTSPNVV